MGQQEVDPLATARQRLADTTRPLRVELAQIDKRLASLAAERGQAEAQLASAGVSPAEIAELGRRLNHIAAETGLPVDILALLQEG